MFIEIRNPCGAIAIAADWTLGPKHAKGTILETGRHSDFESRGCTTRSNKTATNDCAGFGHVSRFSEFPARLLRREQHQEQHRE